MASSSWRLLRPKMTTRAPLRGKPQRDRAANARRAAGDQRQSTCDICKSGMLSFSREM